MSKQILCLLAGCAMIASSASAQNFQRRASFLGGGSPDRGKCTVEVVVDTAAEVEIRGDSANLRTIAGQPAQWRRFECTGPLPANPGDFRFEGIDGRGRQVLVRDPRQSRGTAVIRIEDTKGGVEGYTFDIMWRGGIGSGPLREPWGDDRRDGNRDYNRSGGRARRFTTEQAVEVCETAVRQQAERRFRTQNVNFRRSRLDDNPGRQDWVIGTFEVRRAGRDESYGFSCSVNFDNGQVRSASIGAQVRN